MNDNLLRLTCEVRVIPIAWMKSCWRKPNRPCYTLMFFKTSAIFG